MTMPGRKFVQGSSNYRYGFNGQEKSNEVTSGNYMAEFWEYDSRIGKRWNKDPITKVSESPYSTFGNNPIMLSDPNGADTVNITRTTTRQKYSGNSAGSNGGNTGSAANRTPPDKVTTTGSINIQAAAGLDVFRLTNINTTIDANGNSTSTSSTTTLDIRGTENMGYRNAGDNVKGFHNDKFALAAMAPDWLLDYYANKNDKFDFPTAVGVRDAKALQSDVPFAAGLNKIANVAYTFTGIYGIARTTLSRSIVQAFPSGFTISNVEGFYIRSASSLSNGTYSKTIQSLAYMGENGSGNMLKLVRSIEVEARAVGAKNLEIHGVEIVNSKILSVSKAAAEKIGYTFEQVTSNSIKLTKLLK